MEKVKWTPEYAVGFLLVIFLTALIFFNLCIPDRDFSKWENRKLEQAPHFSFDSLFEGSFTAHYERYMADQFAWKDFWVGVKTDLERLLGKREFNGVYLAEDGYLLQGWSKPDEASFQDKIAAINQFSQANPRVNKYLMLVPTAVEILQDKLPPYVEVPRERDWLDRAKVSLDKNIHFVDVYDALQARHDEYIYYKTDHHWTTQGAFYAYAQWMKEIGITPETWSSSEIQSVTQEFRGSLVGQSGLKDMEPDEIALYQPKNKVSYQVEYFDEEGQATTTQSLYNLKDPLKQDRYDLFLDGNHPLIKITTKETNRKKLLIIKDSYANCLIPFLTNHYGQIYVVDLRYYYEDLNDLIKKNRIKDMLILYNVSSFCEDVYLEGLVDNGEPEEAPASSTKVNYKEFFQEDLFLGDSISEAITYLGLLETSNVCAKVGINIDEARGQLSSIRISNPRNIYLLYGVNDMDDRTDSQWFVEQYRLLVRSVQQKFPEARVYVQSVLPVDAVVERRQPHTNNRYIKQCNEQLANMAEEENAIFLNIAEVLHEYNRHLYEPDGFHFKAPFYQLWFDYIIEYNS